MHGIARIKDIATEGTEDAEIFLEGINTNKHRSVRLRSGQVFLDGINRIYVYLLF